MDFSSLVLMQKDSETGFITKELGSFVAEGAIRKNFCFKWNCKFIF